MQPKPTASVAELRKIASEESGEPFVLLGHISVRKQVGEKLKKVQKQLQKIDPRYDLLIAEGYRSPDKQERYFLQQFLLEYQKDPSCPIDLLMEQTHLYIALPSVAGHPTGGAVDVTLLWEGKEIDMGCKIADFSNPLLLPTFSSAISSKQAENRKLLHDLMLSEHFAPFYGEWWHFSYGDREWAVFYRLTKTMYTAIGQSRSLFTNDR